MIARLLIQLPPGLLLQADDTAQREVYRQWSTLMLVLAILCVIFVTSLAFIVVQRRGRRRREGLPKRPPLKHVNAWEESGRRFEGMINEPDDQDET